MFELKDKIALVTGARRGMGRTHALALARQGAKVVITDIDAMFFTNSLSDMIKLHGKSAKN